MSKGKDDVVLDAIVAEYLQHNEFTTTLKWFQEECKTKGRVLNFGGGLDQSKTLENKRKMMTSFDKGDYRGFFEVWDKLAPLQLLSQKLEFYIQIYFAIFPIHPALTSKNASNVTLEASMDRFRRYLETKGSELSRTPAFLNFYALPFVKEPIKHPSFQQLFLDDWPNEVRVRLDGFLTDSIRSSSPSGSPRLYDLIRNSSYSSPSMTPKKEVTDTRQPAKTDKTTNVKQKLKVGFSLSSHSTLAPLDYKGITSALSSASTPVSQKIALLQALTWRISNSQPGRQRRVIVVTYQHADILCLKTPKVKVYKVLLADKNAMVKEYFLRLVNQIASEYAGRSYLLETDEILTELVKVLKTEANDTVTRQQALGTIQKLSLRRNAQEQMIQLDVIKVLIQFLGDPESLSNYSLEYSTALLMNLSLRSAGKLKCAKSDVPVLQALTELLEHENPRVTTFVNGTLYSILSLNAMKEKAKAIGLGDFLQHLIDDSNGQDSKDQLRFILDQLHAEEEIADSDDDDDNLDDEEEEEVPESFQTSEIPQGENLLCSKYLASTAEASQIIRESLELVEQVEQLAKHTKRAATPQNRPTTPSKNKPRPKRSDVTMTSQETLEFANAFKPKNMIPM